MPLNALEHIKKLPKAQDMADLQAQVDCLLKKNRELKIQVAERESQRKEVEELKDRTKALEEKLVCAREDRNKAVVISRKFHDFIGHPGDVVNKARLYKESTSKPGSLSRPKIIQCVVDYSTKI